VTDTGACEACGQTMIWAMTPNGNRQPIDYMPSETGNVLLMQNNAMQTIFAVVLTGEARKRAKSRGVDLRLPHHATCPHAAQFRRPAPETT
jgi:hypothetical protein